MMASLYVPTIAVREGNIVRWPGAASDELHAGEPPPPPPHKAATLPCMRYEHT